jgi:hypothetical protein
LSSETFSRVLDSLAVDNFPIDKIKENIEELEQIELQQNNLTKKKLKELFVEQLLKSAGRETGAWTVRTLASTLSLMILGM